MRLSEQNRIQHILHRMPSFLAERVLSAYEEIMGKDICKSDVRAGFNNLHLWSRFTTFIPEDDSYLINWSHPEITDPAPMNEFKLNMYFTIYGFCTTIYEALFDGNNAALFRQRVMEWSEFPKHNGGIQRYLNVGLHKLIDDFEGNTARVDASMRAAAFPNQQIGFTLSIGPGRPCPLCLSEDESGLHLPMDA